MLEKKHAKCFPLRRSAKYQDIFMALYISTVLLPWVSGIELGALYNLWLLETLSPTCSFKRRRETFSEYPDLPPVHRSIWITCWWLVFPYWNRLNGCQQTWCIQTPLFKLLYFHLSDHKGRMNEDITCNMYIIYFNTNVTAHTLCFFFS